jgi:hypothetical protein
VDFFYQARGTINTSTPLGQWDVGGFREVAVHLWFQGPEGATVQPTLSFNNLTSASEIVTIGPSPGPGYPGSEVLAKVYPVFAPTLGIVLYNPDGAIDFYIRLYATCCETGTSKIGKLFGGWAARRDRTISGTVDLASLIPAAGPARR